MAHPKVVYKYYLNHPTVVRAHNETFIAVA